VIAAPGKSVDARYALASATARLSQNDAADVSSEVPTNAGSVTMLGVGDDLADGVTDRPRSAAT